MFGVALPFAAPFITGSPGPGGSGPQQRLAQTKRQREADRGGVTGWDGGTGGTDARRRGGCLRNV